MLFVESETLMTFEYSFIVGPFSKICTKSLFLQLQQTCFCSYFQHLSHHMVF